MQTIITPEQREMFEEAGLAVDDYGYLAYIRYGETYVEITKHGKRSIGRLGGPADEMPLDVALTIAAILGIAPAGYVLIPEGVARGGVVGLDLAIRTKYAHERHHLLRDLLAAALHKGTVVPPSQSGGAEDE